jgi:U2 small nuclear ribonucleoprotein B''
VEQTELQQSIFNAPLPGAAAVKPPTAADHAMKDAGSPESRGQKRNRDDEDEDESEEDVAMEEDSDDE